MPLSAGDRLGPYEILTPLGAGGMGEVYKARDIRLDRIVAIKISSSRFSGRFSREARAVAALNHPNICQLYDVGPDYLVMEFVEGTPVGPPDSPRKLLDVAVQIADGLAAAHGAGIVHRDLKPENILLTCDGRIKILDFGLAKAAHLESDAGAATQTMDVALTNPGSTVGTVAYMSPEQARGAVNLTAQSDQFALGLVLYELAAGKRAFERGSAAEIMTAIMREDAEPLPVSVPAPFRWIVERLLHKEPAERYDSTRDLYRELRQVRDRLSESVSGAPATPSTVRRFGWRWAGPAAAVAICAMACALAYRLGMEAIKEPATFQGLLFRHGYIRTARFTPDSQSVVYSAAWEGRPEELYIIRTDNPETRPVGLGHASLLSVSRSGEMAIGLDYRNVWYMAAQGKLSIVALLGGTPREVMNDVMDADFAPDGKNFAVARRVGGVTRLEYPAGKVLCETPGWFSHVRVSPAGDHIAALEHPLWGDDRGWLIVTDLAAHKERVSTDSASAQGVAWTPDGREVWYGALEKENTWTIFAVNRSSMHTRVITRAPRRLLLYDIAPDGRALLSHETDEFDMAGRLRGDANEHLIGGLGASIISDISPDGKRLAVTEYANNPSYVGMLYGAEGSAVRIGEGWPQAFSPDGRSVLALIPSEPMKLAVHPVGPGESRTLVTPSVTSYQWAGFAGPDRLVFVGTERGHLPRIYTQELTGGAPRPISGEGYAVSGRAVAPDGESLLANASNGKVVQLPLKGGVPKAIPELTPEDIVIRWEPDGKSIIAFRGGAVPARVDRIELDGGKRTWVRDLAPADRAGVQVVVAVAMSPDGKWYGYTFRRALDELNIMTIPK